MWMLYAVLSSIFAALTSILAKVGIEGVNSNLATAVRTVVVLIMAWGMVFLTGGQSGLSIIGKKSWIFLILSGLATGASWLCYYKALHLLHGKLPVFQMLKQVAEPAAVIGAPHSHWQHK